MDRPAKRTKLLSDASDPDSSLDDGLSLPIGDSNGFNINEDYAKRFEHNKKREEKHKLEEKYGGALDNYKRSRDIDGDHASRVEDDDESTDESEDDDAELATADLDAEILDTLQAIKSKDPRVYDQNVKFYRDFDADYAFYDGKPKQKEKPMYLQDYHRQNIMAGHTGGEEEDGEAAPVQTYQDEQDQLRRELVDSMHASASAAAISEDPDEGSGEDDFLVAKSKPKHDSLAAVAKPKPVHITDADVAAADKDPETYLSNFMAARAWLPTEGSRFEAFDSDDSEDEKRADEFEEAYNLRFEDPQLANEKLQSFSRNVGKYGVRREEKSGRQRTRDREREKKEDEKRGREEERARLRKLIIEEAEEKVMKIREAAGLRGKDVDLAQWRDIIEGDFEDNEWDQEMKRRFGEKYYEQHEGGDESGDDIEANGKKCKPKKPRWSDEIQINDLVPDFEDEQTRPKITLSSDGDEDADNVLDRSEDGEGSQHLKKGKVLKKDRADAKREAKRAARKQRMAIEEIVDASLPLNHPDIAPRSGPGPSRGFRYRETSPTSFGLSARDILFAQDTQLNQYAGLKKLAAFRDSSKKQKDKRKLGKKARLRQWRRETFGAIEEPVGGFEKVLGGRSVADARHGDEGQADARRSRKKKRKRSKKKADVVAA